MVSRITEIKSSRIFKKLWHKYRKDLKKEVVTMEMIYDNLWKPIRDQLCVVNQQFLSGDMLIKDVDKYLKLFDTNYEALGKEFLLLSKFFSDKTESDVNELKKLLGSKMERVKSYMRLFDAQDASQAIEALAERMGLKGDFSAIENLKEVSFYPLGYVYARHGRFKRF